MKGRRSADDKTGEIQEQRQSKAPTRINVRNQEPKAWNRENGRGICMNITVETQGQNRWSNQEWGGNTDFNTQGVIN